jgi:hypothetical protein
MCKFFILIHLVFFYFFYDYLKPTFKPEVISSRQKEEEKKTLPEEVKVKSKRGCKKRKRREKNPREYFNQFISSEN